MPGWNFADVWESHAERFPDAPAQAQGDRRFTWSEFDRRAVFRSGDELRAREAAAHSGEPPPPVNDLQDAARALCAAIDPAIRAVIAAGADCTMVSGSGPTVFGLFPDAEQARAAAARLPGAVPAEPVR